MKKLIKLFWIVCMALFLNTPVQAQENQITVTNVTYYKYTMPGLGYIQEGIFETDNGQIGFCGEIKQADIRLNQKLDAPVELDRSDIRKILYYGYKGPQDILTGKLGQAGAVCFTSEMLSKAYSGFTASELLQNGAWEPLILPLYEEILQMPDPASTGFKAFVCNNNEYGTSWQGNYTLCQDLLYGTMVPKEDIKIQVYKKSSQETLTQNNASYSLKDAKYGIYPTLDDAKNNTNCLDTLITDEKGNTNIVELPYGTYYVKETKAPKGFKLYPEIMKVIPDQNQNAIVNHKEDPEIPELDVLLKKIDQDTQKGLAGATFSLAFYKTGQEEPAFTWSATTDENGEIHCPKEYVLGYGTLLMKETKAPQGYVLNPQEVRVDLQKPYKPVVFKNKASQFEVKKLQKGTDIPIENAEFMHTMPDGTQETICTDSKGILHFTKLQPGVHSLQEVKVKKGYEINPEVYEFKVEEDGSVHPEELVIYDEVSPYTLQVHKKNAIQKPLDGAEFTLYADKECTKPLQTQTSKKGVATFTGLKDKETYYVKEVKAPKGYQLNEHVYEVYTESIPEQGLMEVLIDQKKGQADIQNRIVSLDVINNEITDDPDTGIAFPWHWPLAMLGSVLMYKLLKKKEVA